MRSCNCRKNWKRANKNIKSLIEYSLIKDKIYHPKKILVRLTKYIKAHEAPNEAKT